MADVIIVHGAYGSPDENWFPWLKGELEKLGCDVHVPGFPTPEGQTLENWLEVFEDYEKYLDGKTIAVGHSLGPAFLLSVLEKLDHPIKAAFFVAGFVKEIGNPDFDSINRTFYREFDWGKIRRNCGHFEVIHSDNDPYVPIGRAEELAGRLKVKLQIVKGAGHFNKASGYERFDFLLSEISGLL